MPLRFLQNLSPPTNQPSVIIKTHLQVLWRPRGPIIHPWSQCRLYNWSSCQWKDSPRQSEENGTKRNTEEPLKQNMSQVPVLKSSSTLTSKRKCLNPNSVPQRQQPCCRLPIERQSWKKPLILPIQKMALIQMDGASTITAFNPSTATAGSARGDHDSFSL